MGASRFCTLHHQNQSQSMIPQRQSLPSRLGQRRILLSMGSVAEWGEVCGSQRRRCKCCTVEFGNGLRSAETAIVIIVISVRERMARHLDMTVDMHSLCLQLIVENRSCYGHISISTTAEVLVEHGLFHKSSSFCSRRILHMEPARIHHQCLLETNWSTNAWLPLNCISYS
jgi:hypothetical protein